MEHRPIEVRSVATAQRTVTVRVAPYGETSYMTDNAAGERIAPRAFERSLRGRERRVKLLRGHDQSRVYGTSRRFTETPEGLVAEFEIRQGPAGDEMLDDLSGGYMDLSAGFITERTGYDAGGVRLIEQARLMEVSAVAIGAYSDAEVLAVRHAHPSTPTDQARGPRPLWETPRLWV